MIVIVKTSLLVDKIYIYPSNKSKKVRKKEMKSFYHFVLTYRGAADDKGHFAEANV